MGSAGRRAAYWGLVVRFPYRRYVVTAPPGQSGAVSIYRPTIPLRIKGPTGETVQVGLLDPGADVTILPGELIDELGVAVDPAATRRFRGVGGHLVTATSGTVTMEIAEGDERYRWTATVASLEGSNLTIFGHGGFLTALHRYL